MVRLRGPAYSDTMVYDLEGRLVRRIETASVAGTLHDDTYTYDARGKLMQVAVGATTGRSPSTYRQYYSGSGMLIATDWQNEFDSGRVQEAFGMDAMGNTAWRRTGDGTYSSVYDSIFRNTHDPGTGRLATIGKWHINPDWREEFTTRSYDPSGNADWAAFEQWGELDEQNVGVARWKGSRSFYAADERLRYFQERDLRGGTMPKHDGVWEEYRYDPLGRRILVNTRTKDLCNTGTAFQCASATTRMVWAGDQLIWELRQASESLGETAGPADAYGTVGYTHAGGIDRPLVITKDGESVLPHQNWRWQFSRGTYASGASSDCTPGQNYSCAKVAWPGWRTTAWHVDAKDPDIRTWWGGLVDGMRDVSGQMYMRNRYYDPATGQFTQQDPIGIAGGLNTYGFAAGDPVSYSDPYGLCPPIESCMRNGLRGARTVAWLEAGQSRRIMGTDITAVRRTDFGVGINQAGHMVLEFRGAFTIDDPELPRYTKYLHLEMGAIDLDTGEFDIVGSRGYGLVFVQVKGNFKSNSSTVKTCAVGVVFCRTFTSPETRGSKRSEERTDSDVNRSIFDSGG